MHFNKSVVPRARRAWTVSLSNMQRARGHLEHEYERGQPTYIVQTAAPPLPLSGTDDGQTAVEVVKDWPEGDVDEQTQYTSYCM